MIQVINTAYYLKHPTFGMVEICENAYKSILEAYRTQDDSYTMLSKEFKIEDIGEDIALKNYHAEVTTTTAVKWEQKIVVEMRVLYYESNDKQ